MSDETKHSPEPWTVTAEDPAGGISDATGSQCAEAWPGCRHEPEDVNGECMAVQDANARRIVAAVNACAGLPTSALEEGALAKALEVLEAAAQPPGTHTVKGLRQLAASALRSLGRLP